MSSEIWFCAEDVAVNQQVDLFLTFRSLCSNDCVTPVDVCVWCWKTDLALRAPVSLAHSLARSQKGDWLDSLPINESPKPTIISLWTALWWIGKWDRLNRKLTCSAQQRHRRASVSPEIHLSASSRAQRCACLRTRTACTLAHQPASSLTPIGYYDTIDAHTHTHTRSAHCAMLSVERKLYPAWPSLA